VYFEGSSSSSRGEKSHELPSHNAAYCHTGRNLTLAALAWVKPGSASIGQITKTDLQGNWRVSVRTGRLRVGTIR
jgi:hypothetical protein